MVIKTLETAQKALQALEAEMLWLRWFYENCDFGPAHDDQMEAMARKYEHTTGRLIPEEYL